MAIAVAGLAYYCGGAAAATVFEVPPGDTQALLDAIRQAKNVPGLRIIRLAEHSSYALDLVNAPPDKLYGDLKLEGSGSALVGLLGVDDYGQLFVIGQLASVEISDLVIRGFHADPDQAGTNQDSLIAIRQTGSLTLTNIQIDDIEAVHEGGVDGGVFSNHGELRLQNVRVTNVTSLGVAIVLSNWGTAELENVLMTDGRDLSEPDPSSPGFYVYNRPLADANIRYSTFLPRSDLAKPDRPVRLYTGLGGFCCQPTATVTASLLLDVGCLPGSGGFNLVTDSSCTPRKSTDIVGVPAGPLRVDAEHGYTVVPRPGSPALDGVSKGGFACPATDAVGVARPQDGTGNGKARCDIGAFEAPSPAALFEGGANGLFFDASHDGHYVLIQEVSPNRYFVHWTAFDLDGKQSWIFAVGSREGDTITAQAWLQTEGALIQGGSVDVNTDALQDWGTVSVRLDDCLKGEFSYQSVLPQFSSGSFPLDRLAYIDQLGCRDSSP